MRIDSEKLSSLDNDSYEKIIIVEDKLNTSYNLEIIEKETYLGKQLPLESDKFSKSISNLSETEKVKQIINYFLNNNKIIALDNTGIIDGYNRLFNIIQGESTLLALRLYCDKKILSDCALKYSSDRNKFLRSKKEIKDFDLGTSDNETSYQAENYYGHQIIKLNLLKKDGNLWWIDENFLKSWILEKLIEQSVEANYYSRFELDGYVIDIAKITCGDINIYLKDKLLYQKLVPILDEYNKTIGKQKILQLKMEGL
jgi:hypothetical protein